MRRGTTPTLTFKLNFDDYSLVDRMELTLFQGYKNLFTRVLDITENGPTITLSQEDTLRLEVGTCKIQIKVIFLDGKVYATGIKELPVYDILDDEVEEVSHE